MEANLAENFEKWKNERDMKKFFKYAERLDQELKKMQYVARADEMITVLGAHKTNVLRADEMNASSNIIFSSFIVP
jgi:hypothetical protein